MKTIGSIMLNEHKNILAVVAAVEKQINLLEDGEPISEVFFRDAIVFLREYADGVHHAKEEDVLFKVIAEEGFDKKNAEVKRLVHQHILSRQLFKEIEEALNDNKKKALQKKFREYFSLIREHIHEEDEVLFPLLEELLPIEIKDRILKQFDEADARQDLKKYLSLKAKLESAIAS